MNASEVEKWESYYNEAAQRDFERAIYKRCGEEDAAIEGFAAIVDDPTSRNSE